MKSYLDILTERSEATKVSLLKAFKSSGVPTSTYYRTINGNTELRYETAKKVVKAIEKLYALEQARGDTRELRESGNRIDRRKIRAKHKPRSTSA
jgi:predicted transcriptional regulator